MPFTPLPSPADGGTSPTPLNFPRASRKVGEVDGGGWRTYVCMEELGRVRDQGQQIEKKEGILSFEKVCASGSKSDPRTKHLTSAYVPREKTLRANRGRHPDRGCISSCSSGSGLDAAPAAVAPLWVFLVLTAVPPLVFIVLKSNWRNTGAEALI